MSPDREVRIRQAVAAYEATFRDGYYVPIVSLSNDHVIRYWDKIIDRLKRYNLPLPDIENLAFLDLGGGSDKVSVLDRGDAFWRPWLPRYLATLGAPYVVNVDQGPQDSSFNDVYTHIQLELSDNDDFSLPDELKKHGQLRRYDIIFTAMLVDEDNASPSLSSSIEPSRLKSRIKDWATELLRPGGYLFFEGGYEGYMLIDGRLVNFCGQHTYQS